MSGNSDEYVVQPRGELDLATVPAVREEWVETIEAVRPARFVIDLADVTFLDSTALGAIIAVHKLQRKHGGDVLVIHPTRMIARVFQVTRLGWLLDLRHPDRALLP